MLLYDEYTKLFTVMLGLTIVCFGYGVYSIITRNIFQALTLGVNVGNLCFGIGAILLFFLVGYIYPVWESFKEYYSKWVFLVSVYDPQIKKTWLFKDTFVEPEAYYFVKEPNNVFDAKMKKKDLKKVEELLQKHGLTFEDLSQCATPYYVAIGQKLVVVSPQLSEERHFPLFGCAIVKRFQATTSTANLDSGFIKAISYDGSSEIHEPFLLADLLLTSYKQKKELSEKMDKRVGDLLLEHIVRLKDDIGYAKATSDLVTERLALGKTQPHAFNVSWDKVLIIVGIITVIGLVLLWLL